MDTKPKLFTFVLMPLSKDFDDIYQLGIKETCSELDIYCERVDEQIFQETILERIYNQIAKADLIVADMTGKNPNVFYEVGYAHALGKNVILLTKESKDIPFDLKHYPHIVYEGKITLLKSELKKRLSWFIENPEKVEDYFNTTVELFLNNHPIIDNPCIEVEKPDNMANVLYLQFNIHNSIEKYIENISFQMGIISDNNVREFYQKNTDIKQYQQKNKNFIHIIDDYYSIVPGSWDVVNISLIKDGDLKIEEVFNLTARLFFDFGVIDFPFSIKTKI